MNDIEKNTFHPSHYNKEGRKECWEEMEEIFGKAFVVGFCIGSAYKYLYRKGEKDGNSEEQDIAKIKNYMVKAHILLCQMGKTDEPRLLDAGTSYIKMCEILEKEGIDYGRETGTEE